MRTTKPKTPVGQFEGTVRKLNSEIAALNKKIEYRDKQLEGTRNSLNNETEIKHGLLLFIMAKGLYNEWSEWFARFAVGSLMGKMKDSVQ